MLAEETAARKAALVARARVCAQRLEPRGAAEHVTVLAEADGRVGHEKRLVRARARARARVRVRVRARVSASCLRSRWRSRWRSLRKSLLHSEHLDTQARRTTRGLPQGAVRRGAVRGSAHCHCARLSILLRLSCGSSRSLSGCSGHEGEIATPRSSRSSRAAFRASRDAARSHPILCVPTAATGSARGWAVRQHSASESFALSSPTVEIRRAQPAPTGRVVATEEGSA